MNELMKYILELKYDKGVYTKHYMAELIEKKYHELKETKRKNGQIDAFVRQGDSSADVLLAEKKLIEFLTAEGYYMLIDKMWYHESDNEGENPIDAKGMLEIYKNSK